MKNIKKDIPSLLGFLVTTSLALISGGLANPAVGSIIGSVGGNIGANLAANFLSSFNPARIKKWFVDIHPNDLNHSIKKLFVKSINEALYHISVLFSETNTDEAEKKKAQRLIKTLQKQLSDILSDNTQMKINETEVQHFLYEKNENAVCSFIENKFADFGITEPFKSFLTKNLPAQIQLCFGESLKEPANYDAWIAFQRMLIEEIRNDIKQIANTQQSIKDDLSDLKFENSGLSEEQITEIRKLIKILNNKELVEVKIKTGINQSLKSIEKKANEIICITTKTQITVDKLKIIIEKMERQNRTNHIIIYILTSCLLFAGMFVAYKLINQPFTTTVQIYGWAGEQHNPLNGKGSLVLTLKNRTEKAEINRQGEAIFKGISPEYNGKMVPVRITDMEGEPYYLTDSTITIRKNNITKIQLLLHGLERLQGTVFDNISSEGLPGVSVTVAGISTITDAKGYFSIDIPVEKQLQEQKIIISKERYKEIREIVSMTGEYNVMLERK